MKLISGECMPEACSKKYLFSNVLDHMSSHISSVALQSKERIELSCAHTRCTLSCILTSFYIPTFSKCFMIPCQYDSSSTFIWMFISLHWCSIHSWNFVHSCAILNAKPLPYLHNYIFMSQLIVALILHISWRSIVATSCCWIGIICMRCRRYSRASPTCLPPE